MHVVPCPPPRTAPAPCDVRVGAHVWRPHVPLDPELQTFGTAGASRANPIASFGPNTAWTLVSCSAAHDNSCADATGLELETRVALRDSIVASVDVVFGGTENKRTATAVRTARKKSTSRATTTKAAARRKPAAKPHVSDDEDEEDEDDGDGDGDEEDVDDHVSSESDSADDLSAESSSDSESDDDDEAGAADDVDDGGSTTSSATSSSSSSAATVQSTLRAKKRGARA